MNELRTTCPGCGKPVVFCGSFSMSSICDACGTIVVRPDYGHPLTGQGLAARTGGQTDWKANSGETPAQQQNFATSGTIPPPTGNDSPLEFGMRGIYQGHSFEIRGVVRLEHDAGGFWDEWYLLFDDGRWGWLAEVQQHFYLTFAVDLKKAATIPSFDKIRLEERFLLRPGEPPMTVIEKGCGRPLGARGEIPYALAPRKVYQYADLSGPGGRFATIDFEETPPSLYFGRSVALGDLHLPHKPEDLGHEPRHVEAVNADCPNCRHSLTLRIPHKTVRVGCTACGAILDAAEGRLQLVRTIAGASKPRLPLGAKGPLFGVQYTVVGYLKRCLKSDASEAWDEYLLYDSHVGYRWLTASDEKWYFVQTVPAGNVELQGKNVLYDGKTFRWHEQDIALVSCVLGEFYWKVDRGEQIWMTDYIRPPEMLSREITHGGPDTGEISWSRAVFLSVKTIEQAFGLQPTLPRPASVAPSLPSSFRWLYVWWAAMVGLTILAGIFFQFHHRCQQVFHKTYSLPVAPQAVGQAGKADVQPNLANGDFGGGAAACGEEGPLFFSEPFEVRDHENIEVRLRSSNTNFWLGVDGDLVDEQSGVVQEFSLPMEYYEGVSDGESWTEGSREASAYLSALPAGQYTLRIVGHHEPPNVPLSFEVGVYENVARTQHLLVALAGVSLIPGIVLALQLSSAYLRRQR